MEPDENGEVTIEVSTGLPEGGAAHQQLVTDAEGNAKWEDRIIGTYTTSTKAWYSNYDLSCSMEIIPGELYASADQLNFDGILLGENYAHSFFWGKDYGRIKARTATITAQTEEGSQNEEFSYWGNGTLFLKLVTLIGGMEPEGSIIVDGIEDTGEDFCIVLGGAGMSGEFAGMAMSSYAKRGNLIVYGIASVPVPIPDSFLSFYESGYDGKNGWNFGSGQTSGIGEGAFIQGYACYAQGIRSHAEGNNCFADGDYSHVEGWCNHAGSDYQHVEGRYNIEDVTDKYIHIAGNGDYAERANAYTLDWDGNGWFAGTVESTGIIIKSSTPGSKKRFKITVDNSGAITATEVTE